MYFVNSEKSRNNPNFRQREEPRLGLKTVHQQTSVEAKAWAVCLVGGGYRNDLVSAHLELTVQRGDKDVQTRHSNVTAGHHRAVVVD